MAGLRFNVQSLGMVRFAVSPLWETVAAVRLLQRPGGGLLGGWTAARRGALDDLPWLRALIPPVGHLADILTPAPPRARNGFTAELTAVAATEPAALVEDLEHLLGDGRCSDPRRIRGALADPAAALAVAVTELRTAHDRLVAPLWPRLRAVAEADIGHRIGVVGESGALRMLAGLHPRVTPTADGLAVTTSCPEDTALSDGDGLVLVPCGFAWPEVLLMRRAGSSPTLAYAPRGIAALWGDTDRARAGLPELLGRTRAQILTLLEQPMTTGQLAHSLGVAAPSVSPQVAVLRDNGLVDSTRRGRLVLHHRTARGDVLIDGD